MPEQCRADTVAGGVQKLAAASGAAHSTSGHAVQAMHPLPRDIGLHNKLPCAPRCAAKATASCSI